MLELEAGGGGQGSERHNGNESEVLDHFQVVIGPKRPGLKLRGGEKYNMA